MPLRFCAASWLPHGKSRDGRLFVSPQGEGDETSHVLIATLLKFGDRTWIGAVHLATSLVADL
jgi:hypothetical protein